MNNILKKLPVSGVLLLARLTGEHIAKQSAVFADPKPAAFGTRLHTTRLQNSSQNYFVKRLVPSQGSTPLNECNKKSSLTGTFLLVRLTGVEPATTRRRRPVLYPLSYKRVLWDVKIALNAKDKIIIRLKNLLKYRFRYFFF